MKIDRKVMGRMDAFSKRVANLRDAVSAAHAQLQAMANHANYKHVGVIVGDLNGDEFQVQFVGVVLITRLLPEMSDAGAAQGKLCFYEKSRQVGEVDRFVGSVKVKPDGMSDLVDEDGDERELSYFIMEVVLQMCEIVLKNRAGKAVQVGGLSI